MIMEFLDTSLSILGGLIVGLVIGVVTPILLELHGSKSLRKSLYREIGSLYVAIKDLCDRIEKGDSAKQAIEHYAYNSLFPLFDLVAKDLSKLERFYQLNDSAAILEAYRMLCSPFRPGNSQNPTTYEDQYLELAATITQFEILVKQDGIHLDTELLSKIGNEADKPFKRKIDFLIDPSKKDVRDLTRKLANVRLISSDKLLDENKDGTDARYNKGLALDRLGRHSEAIAEFDKVLQVDGKNLLALAGKGIALDRSGEYQEAITCFDQALKIDPRHTISLVGRGWALIELGEYDEATAWFDRALKIDPRYTYALAGKGLALSRKNDFDHAVDCYNKALKIDGNDINTLAHKGLALTSLRQCKNAFVCYERALEIDPEDACTLLNKAETLLAQHKEEDAKELLKKVIEVNPCDVSLLDKLIGNLEQVDLLDAAIVCCDKVLDINKSLTRVVQKKASLLQTLTKDFD